jgi:hypothetical protein
MKILSKKIAARIILYTSIIFMGLLLYWNQKTALVYFCYCQYSIEKLMNESNEFVIADIRRTMDSAKDAGYSCNSKDTFRDFSYKEIIKRRKFSSLSNSYFVSECVRLPTEEVILSSNYSNTKYYILLKRDVQEPEGYRVLDIRGETIG